MSEIVRLRGNIVSSGFASGDRVVVGFWNAGPLGPMVDVMWASPGGHRTLFAPSTEVGDFITSVYDFDSVEVVAIDGRIEGPVMRVSAGDRTLRFTRRRRVPIFGPRPLWLTRFVEAPIARALMGVQTYGVSPRGVEEWYQARSHAGLAAAVGMIKGVDLGSMAPVDPPAGFGFSEPPPTPSWVRVHPSLRYDSLPAVLTVDRPG